MKTIKAIFINAHTQKVTDVEITPTLKAYYELMQVSCIEAIGWVIPRNILYVDEEGQINGTQKGFLIQVGDIKQPILGNAIILSTDGEGNDISVKNLKATDIKIIKWYNYKYELTQPF